jgi:hypothetical protein
MHKLQPEARSRHDADQGAEGIGLVRSQFLDSNTLAIEQAFVRTPANNQGRPANPIPGQGPWDGRPPGYASPERERIAAGQGWFLKRQVLRRRRSPRIYTHCIFLVANCTTYTAKSGVRTNVCSTHACSKGSTAKMTATEDRFWAKVAIAGPEECWEWTGYRTPHGYGQCGGARSGKARARTYLAHRLAYELSIGEIPGGLLVDHICRNRACVNPAHLRLATAKQNAENRSLARNNTSGLRGVSWHSRDRKWEAKLAHDGRSIYLGYFKTAEAAYEARMAKECELFTHSAGSDIDDISYVIPGHLSCARQLEMF